MHLFYLYVVVIVYNELLIFHLLSLHPCSSAKHDTLVYYIFYVCLTSFVGVFFSFFKPHLALITLLIKSKSWLGFWHYLKYLSAAFAMTTYLIRIILRTMYILQTKKWTIKLQIILEVYFVKHNIFSFLNICKFVL